MLLIGDARQLGMELFPEGFVPDVLNLIIQTWVDFRLPANVRLEEPITALFRVALMDRYCAEGKDWFVTLEEPNIDPATGVEVSRTDLRFLPPGIKHTRRAFVLESKRLNIPSGSNASAYTGDEGMMRFVIRKYSPNHNCGGMVGYVMDGKVSKAHTTVVTSIRKCRQKLKMLPDGDFTACRHTPNHPHTGETRHRRDADEFVIYHLFLGVK